MADRTTAEDRLHRLLWLVPRAAREGGATVSALARELGITPAELMRDIDEATTRAFYQPPGSPDPFAILIEADAQGDATIEVHPAGEFTRPPRLTPREALAVALGLRAMAAEVVPEDRAEVLDVARLLEQELTTPDVRADNATQPARVRRKSAGQSEPEGAQASKRDDVVEGEEPTVRAVEADIEATLADATARRLRCRIAYMKPGAEPSERTIEPYRLIHAGGTWYVLARDAAHDGMRLFRFDRIASVRIEEGSPFDVPADFDPADYLTEEGLPFFSASEEEVVVRYDPPAARWVAEAEGVRQQPDGTVTIRHRVADPGWIVRRVLSFGGAAEALAPERIRDDVACVARTIRDRHSR